MEVLSSVLAAPHR